MSYLVDSDVFIQAKNRHYPFDFCPGFWDWIDSAYAYRRVFSVARVYDELCAGEDELTAWAKARGAFFLPPTDAVLASMRDVSDWATRTEYTQAAVAEFLDAADYYLVAHAKAHGFTVVTAEVPSEGLNRVKIPNACQALGVRYTDVFAMLRTEGARFVMA